ncbi:MULTISPECIES: flagellar biosynthesis anti-sigma factor FlgM [Paenibacillus]|jgi:negative regulator of flagellin synthesis FlgM|uniref:Negative regulator of flagellin synthesis n=1 Tax=Paenibacillus timonensis TaxID=225915 RepID=A0ABW3S9M5_9BACL|nr:MULTISPECIES: flagellar biosynthesis anti-sigma factor FlgM [Paenibacillus]MCH1640515.1 flagellar biosynthesis anti-sigma factor FlgM [Paenibacillus timonensis]MDU2242277.1 flagellar biosynthesis anti-sigma factor FlgM [Paenibacillus sp.]MDU4695608.1 flagellar biosynthesis anti-sigma factor FlgM [Paenibacillus sp.]
MKINETGRVGAINNYQRQVESQRKDTDSKARRKDEVSISAEAKELLKAQEGGISPERAERIEELKTQVSSGTYHVETGKIADKLAPYFKSFLNEK